MADVTLPQLGETVTEGTITRWFKKVGDTVRADEPLFEQMGSNGQWKMRVVANRYPAFEGDGNLTVRNLGPVHTMADASGIHEVFVITPDHPTSTNSIDRKSVV